MTAIIILLAIVTITGILFGGFMAVCGRIRRIDKCGNLRPETLTPRHHMLAYAARWDDDKPAFA